MQLNDKDFGSINHRKRTAYEYYGTSVPKERVQEVLDMPKREYHTFCIGLKMGELKAATDIKSEFFCVPIDIYLARKKEFTSLVLEVRAEMLKLDCKNLTEKTDKQLKEANNDKTDEKRNDDCDVETGSDGEGETENSEEQQ